MKIQFYKILHRHRYFHMLHIIGKPNNILFANLNTKQITACLK